MRKGCPFFHICSIVLHFKVIIMVSPLATYIIGDGMWCFGVKFIIIILIDSGCLVHQSRNRKAWLQCHLNNVQSHLNDVRSNSMTFETISMAFESISMAFEAISMTFESNSMAFEAAQWRSKSSQWRSRPFPWCSKPSQWRSRPSQWRSEAIQWCSKPLNDVRSHLNDVRNHLNDDRNGFDVGWEMNWMERGWRGWVIMLVCKYSLFRQGLSWRRQVSKIRRWRLASIIPFTFFCLLIMRIKRWEFNHEVVKLL